MTRGLGRFMRSNFVALLALFVALGGTSIAASNVLLPRNSVGTAQLKNGAVTKKKINRKTIRALRGNRGPIGPRGLVGPQGPQGPKGDTGARGPAGPAGAPGTALAYARILGTVDAEHSKGITAANVTHPSDGVYCFGGLSFTPRNVVVTPLHGYSAQQGTADLGQGSVTCPAGTQATVLWSIGGTLVDAGFFILVN